MFGRLKGKENNAQITRTHSNFLAVRQESAELFYLKTCTEFIPTCAYLLYNNNNNNNNIGQVMFHLCSRQVQHSAEISPDGRRKCMIQFRLSPANSRDNQNGCPQETSGRVIDVC